MDYGKYLLPFASVCAKTYTGEYTPIYQDPLRLVHLYLFTHPDGLPIFTYEGTHDWEEWFFVDFDAVPIVFPDYLQLGVVHPGFFLDALHAHETILTYCQKNSIADFYVAGHSKGAAEAIATHAILKWHGHEPKATIALEPPRVGGVDFVAYLKDDPITWTRTLNIEGSDLVTEVPFKPIYESLPSPVILSVPNSYGRRQKHSIQAVIGALQQAA